MSGLNISELIATTLRNRNPKLADNITGDNWLLSTLREKGHIKNASGGRVLSEPIAYAENSNAAFYDGYETFTITPDESISLAEYDWKQLGGFATISGAEEIMNSGKYAALNLIKSRLDVLEMTLKNKAGAGVYADGTTDTKAFGGLEFLIADDPTAIADVGGIDQNANAWWRNQYNAVGAAVTSSNVLGLMNSMWLATRRGKDATDLISASYDMYTPYEESLQQYQRFADSKKAAAGFESLKYKSADVIADDECPDLHMYFVNTSYLYMQRSAKRDFTVGKTRLIENGDSSVTPVWFMGNLTCSNRARQGVIIGS